MFSQRGCHCDYEYHSLQLMSATLVSGYIQVTLNTEVLLFATNECEMYKKQKTQNIRKPGSQIASTKHVYYDSNDDDDDEFVRSFSVSLVSEIFSQGSQGIITKRSILESVISNILSSTPPKQNTGIKYDVIVMCVTFNKSIFSSVSVKIIVFTKQTST